MNDLLNRMLAREVSVRDNSFLPPALRS